MASFWKKMKKTFVFKSAKSVGRVGGKVVKLGAPLAGGLFLGPLGALGGTVLAGAASQVGPNKDRGKALKGALIYGGGVTLGTVALGLVSGAGAGAPLLSSAQSLFGTNPAAPAPAEDGSQMVFSYDKPAPAPAGGSVVDAAAKTAAAVAGQATGAQQNYLNQLALAEKLRAQGDLEGAAQAQALAETYRQLIESSGQQVPSAGLELSPWLVGGGILLLVLFSRGKAA